MPTVWGRPAAWHLNTMDTWKVGAYPVRECKALVQWKTKFKCTPSLQEEGETPVPASSFPRQPRVTSLSWTRCPTFLDAMAASFWFLPLSLYSLTFWWHLKQFLQKYSVKQYVEYFLKRLRFASLKLSFFYVFSDMCRYRIQDWKLEIIFSSELWCFASDLFILMLLIYSLMPFWLLTFNEWSTLFFWKLLEYSLYNILKFHGGIVSPPLFKNSLY